MADAVDLKYRVGKIAWNDIFFDSIVASRMAHAAQREGMASEIWFERAKKNSAEILTHFATYGFANDLRPTLRSIPWFEGVFATAVRDAGLTDDQRKQVQKSRNT